MRREAFYFLAAVGLLFFPGLVLAETPKDTAAETAACLAEAQLSYDDAVSQCIKEASAVLTQASTSSLFGYRTAEEAAARAAEFEKKYQDLAVEAQKKQAACHGSGLVERYNKETAECYARGSFDELWEKLQPLRQSLLGVFADYKNLSAEQGQELSVCIDNWAERYDASRVSARAETALSQCFTAAGLKGFAKAYETTAVIVDCAQDELTVETPADAARLTREATREQIAYIEQCVIKRLAPAVTGLAALNIPLAAGWHNVLLLGQLIITEPLFLLRRRKYKNWGKVFDSVTTEPVDLGSVRLVNHETAKVVATAVTGRSGAYFFLPPPGAYRVEVDKPGYHFPSSLAAARLVAGHYFGEPIAIERKDDVIDKHIPVDPYAGRPSIALFHWRKWKYRLALTFGLAAPLLSFVALLYSRAWWVVVLATAHALLLAVFIRLAWRKKQRQFGVVTGRGNKSLSGVVVSLFRPGDNKLLHYYVTDLFGRYYFPLLVGEFTVTFVKPGYQKKEITVTVKDNESVGQSLNIMAQLEKTKDL